MTIDVCICTYRRPGIEQTLESIARQVLPQGEGLRVIVADNDVDPSARDLVLACAARLKLEVSYVHAPARNISIARNACLDAVTAPVAVFIDDDEEASPDWIATLLADQARTGADVVFGSVTALYPPEAPAWLARADLHSTRATVREGGLVESGYTCNVLFRTAVLDGLRFDPELGRSGGEDSVFFNQLHRAGAKLAYCEDAVVTEVVAPGRWTLNWLLSRSFRAGQTHGRMLLQKGAARFPNVALACAKALFSLGQALIGLLTGAWRRALVRAALHFGVIARLLGRKELQLY